MKETGERSARNERLPSLIGIGLVSLWAALALILFFEEHPFQVSSFIRLLMNFTIPFPLKPEKSLLAARHLSLIILMIGAGVLGGRLLLKFLGIRASASEDKLEIAQHLMLALGLGWGLLMYAALALAALGRLHSQAIWLLLLGVLALGFPEARKLSLDMRVLFRKRDFRRRPRRLLHAFLLVYFWIVAGSVLLVALAPAITHDAMVYHLNVPRIYADSHKIVPIPYNLFSNTVLNVEMLYAMALSVDDFILANLLHFSMGMSALLTLYVFAKAHFGGAVAKLAALILFFNPLVLNEISIAYVDLGMMFYFLLMMMCLWKWKTEGGNRWFLLFCVYSGIFAGIKYTSLHGLVAAGVVIAAAQLSKKDARGFLVKSALFGGIVTLFVLPYLIKNYLFTGNPVYPLMYDLFGGKWLTPGQVERMLAYVDSHGMGSDWKNMALLPWNITIRGKSGFEHFDAVITPLWLAFLPAFALARRKPPVLKWALLVCAVYFLSWSLSTHITRYLMPIFPLLSLICAYSVIELKDRLTAVSPNAGRLAAAALAIVCGMTWFSFSYFYPLRAPSEFGAVVWGSQSRDEFLAKIVPAYTAFQYINRHLPEDARFAFFWDNRGFFCERYQIGDSVFEAPSMLEMAHEAGSPGAFHDKLRSMNIYYILFNELYHSKFPPYALSVEDSKRLEADYRILEEFLKGYCLPFFTADGTTLYSVHI